MSTDRYLTLARESEGLYREKASRFISYAFPITDEQTFSDCCALIAREHHASRHVCYAWLLGAVGDRYRANDAGEPTGTAGRPILQRLRTAGLTCSAIVVVRYFGGTLLGKAGLVHAYGEAARLALAENTIIEHILRDELNVRCTYAQLEHVRHDVLRCEGELLKAEYGEVCSLNVSIASGQREDFIERWGSQGASITALQPK